MISTSILPLILGIVSGICLGTGLIYLFISLRRKRPDWLHLTFASFAISYGLSVATALLLYKADSVDTFLWISKVNGIFVGIVLIFLLWFVALYTGVRPRVFLIALTIVFGLMVVMNAIRPAGLYAAVVEMDINSLPWGERYFLPAGIDSVWSLMFFLVELTAIVYFFYALIRQYIAGERREALALGAGLFLFALSLVSDILLIESGLISFILPSEFGFLPLAVVMSLQLANGVIQTEEELAQYHRELESLVEERTAELQQANEQMLAEVSERERAQLDLRQSERTARALLDAPPDSALLIDPQGVIMDINQLAAEMLDVEPASAIGVSVYTLFDPEIAAQREAKVAQLVETGLPVRWEDERQDRFYDNNLYPILDDNGKVTSIAVFSVDITERKQVEERLKTSAAAEERTRLARDLHDAVTQTVYSASLIAEVLPAVWERDPQEGQRNLAKLRQLVRGALGEMRTLLFELRLSALEAADLSTLLGLLSDALTGRSRIPVEVAIDGESTLPKDVKVALYRITQEAFNNIAKHSEATRVIVNLRADPGQVILGIRDNGRGFDPEMVPADKLGMRIMQERAEEVGAELEVHSEVGTGTRVSVEWREDGRK